MPPSAEHQGGGTLTQVHSRQSAHSNRFRDQIGQMLTGPGRTSIAIFAAMWLMPLMITWGLVDRYLRRRARRRADPYR